jgi:putative ABC transport system substrate-binding protein
MAACALPRAGMAQPARVWRVGWLEWTDKGRYSEMTSKAFIEGLRSEGFVEGRNLAIEKRVAFGDKRLLSAQAKQLAALKLDALFTPTKAATDAAWYASREIPTVIATVTDPIAVQYAESLAHPGKHITGVTTASAELTGKRLELLKELMQGATRIAVLYDKTLYDSCQEELKQFRAAAERLNVTLIEVPVPNLATSFVDLEPAFRTVVEKKARAMIMPLFTSVSDLAPEVARLALKYRVPTMHEVSSFSEVGGLITYGPDFADIYARAAHYVARILRGEKPAQMAIEEPRRFRLTLNRKTAMALGISIPQSILIRADEVIE